MTLTSEYRYIGRSAGLRNIGGGYHYYLLLYAKTAGSAVTGKHTVSLQVRIACDLDVYFYGFATSAYGKADGQALFSWNGQYVPAGQWDKDLTAGGVTYPRWALLGEGKAELYVGYGVGKEITLEAAFQRLSINDAPDYLPIINTETVSCKVSLPPLVGASVPGVSADGVDMGSSVTIRTNRKSTALTHRITYEFAGRSGLVAENVTDSVVWTPPLALAEAIPTAAAAGATIYCQTYADGAPVEEPQQVGLTLRVPQNGQTCPQVALKLSPQGDLAAAFQGLYIQNLTALKPEVSAEGKYGATVSGYEVLVGGSVYTGGMLTHTGQITVTVRATDSRGFVGQVQQTITVLPYSRPALLPAEGVPAILCGRCNERGSFTADGTHLRIVVRRSYSPVVSGGVQKNFCPVHYRINGGAWQLLLAADAADAIDTAAMALTLEATKSYTVELRAADELGGSATFTKVIPTDRVDIHLRPGGGGVALGGYSTREGFECNLPAFFTAGVRADDLLGRYITVNSANLLQKAANACLGKDSSAGLLLMANQQDPRQFCLCYYYYVWQQSITVSTLAANGMGHAHNVYGTVSARDENGNPMEGICYTVLPCFAVA